MKKTILVLLCLLLSAPVVFGEINPKDKKKFKTVITITYNEATLTEAAALERGIKGNHIKACKVDVELRAVESSSITSVTER